MDNASPEDYDDRHSEVESGDDDVVPKLEDSQSSPNATGKGVKASTHLQKRRRVTRACDECRRKKIKCDGKQPCTHCTVYSYGKWTNATIKWAVGVRKLTRVGHRMHL